MPLIIANDRRESTAITYTLQTAHHFRGVPDLYAAILRNKMWIYSRPHGRIIFFAL
jgi:hypothetical protein